MRRRLKARLGESEAGMTLVEMLIAAMVSIIVLGATSSMLISTVRTQPKISDRAQDASTARWVLERMTRELRNGIAVENSSSSQVAFTTNVRHASCGSSTALPPSSSAIECKVTYSCSSTQCTRSETTPADPGTGTPVTIFTGINSEKVFTVEEPDEDGAAFVSVTLRFPDPDGGGNFTISDGATLRGIEPLG